MDENKTINVSILIDAENVTSAHADQVMEYAAPLGNIISREVFGSANALNMWVEPILKYAFSTKLSVRTTKGKNTSDIALVIGAMDLLMKGNTQVFVIVSSDSDFSPLAMRLREAGVKVIGMGVENANVLWKVACTEYIAFPSDAPESAASYAADSAEVAEDGAATPESEYNVQLSVPDSPEERRMLIASAMREYLEEKGGRLQMTTLCSLMSKLPVYVADKQEAGFKKATQYLQAVYGDLISIEIDEENKSWVCLKGQAQIAEETDLVTGEENSVEPENKTGSIVSRLMENGLDAETAQNVAEAAETVVKPLQIYNRLRKQYGNELGSDYYYKLKAVL